MDAVRAPRRSSKGIPWILQGSLYAILGLLLGVLARYIDLHPSRTAIWLLARSLSDLPFWMMAAIGIAVYSKNGLAAWANVLLFFSLMDISYYWYSWYYDGSMFTRLFIFWMVAGIGSAFLAPLVKWAKGPGIVGFILSAMVLAAQTVITGWSVIGFNFFWFVGSVIFLRRKSFWSTVFMALLGGSAGIGIWVWMKDHGVSSLLRNTQIEQDSIIWINKIREALDRIAPNS